MVREGAMSGREVRLQLQFPFKAALAFLAQAQELRTRSRAFSYCLDIDPEFYVQPSLAPQMGVRLLFF